MSAPLRRLVRPLPKGQVTIPAPMRKALGINEDSVLEIALAGNRIEITRLDRPEGFRVYSDEEVAEFLEQDRITPETAQRVRELMSHTLL